MAFLKFLKFIKLRRRRPNRVVVDSRRRRVDADTGCNGDGIEDGSGRRFNWDEMVILTGNFSRVIGSGGFSTVYLAQFPDSTLGAIKIHNSSISGISERLNQVYEQELQILIHHRHDNVGRLGCPDNTPFAPNIVKFHGYCEGRVGVLVFEYVSNGSLQENLHGCRGAGSTGVQLPWKNRMAIAFQLAQAIEYLHDKCALQIVHGDIKASNILLDERLNCKLCDFGSAKMGFSSSVLPPRPSSSSMNQLMLGSPGYVDPYYLRTGIASKKNDVYSFGVIVLELITGIEAFCAERGQMLTSLIAGDLLRMDRQPEATKVANMVDQRLNGQFDLDEARAMASIAALCLHHSPTLRPSAADICVFMKDKIASMSFLYSQNKIFDISPPPLLQ